MGEKTDAVGSQVGATENARVLLENASDPRNEQDHSHLEHDRWFKYCQSLSYQRVVLLTAIAHRTRIRE